MEPLAPSVAPPRGVPHRAAAPQPATRPRAGTSISICLQVCSELPGYQGMPRSIPLSLLLSPDSLFQSLPLYLCPTPLAAHLCPVYPSLPHFTLRSGHLDPCPPRRRHSQGRSLCRHHAGRRSGVAAVWPLRARRHGHDGRADAARPGAAHRGSQGEAARGKVKTGTYSHPKRGRLTDLLPGSEAAGAARTTCLWAFL